LFDFSSVAMKISKGEQVRA